MLDFLLQKILWSIVIFLLVNQYSTFEQTKVKKKGQKWSI